MNYLLSNLTFYLSFPDPCTSLSSSFFKKKEMQVVYPRDWRSIYIYPLGTKDENERVGWLERHKKEEETKAYSLDDQKRQKKEREDIIGS